MPTADPLEVLQRRVRFVLMLVILALLVVNSRPELQGLYTGHVAHPQRTATRVLAIVIILAIMALAHRLRPRPQPAQAEKRT